MYKYAVFLIVVLESLFRPAFFFNIFHNKIAGQIVALLIVVIYHFEEFFQHILAK